MSARVALSVRPSQDFSLRYAAGDVPAEYQAAINNGLFSVLMGHGHFPVLGGDFRVEEAVIHPVEACYVAFFEAARQATEELLGLSADAVHNIAC